MSVLQKLKELIEPIVAEAGFECLNIEFSTEFGTKALVVTIDTPEHSSSSPSSNEAPSSPLAKRGHKGVTAEDCRTVAKKINRPLDEADLIPDHYMFIVSSPGSDNTPNTGS